MRDSLPCSYPCCPCVTEEDQIRQVTRKSPWEAGTSLSSLAPGPPFLSLSQSLLFLPQSTKRTKRDRSVSGLFLSREIIYLSLKFWQACLFLRGSLFICSCVPLNFERKVDRALLYILWCVHTCRHVCIETRVGFHMSRSMALPYAFLIEDSH